MRRRGILRDWYGPRLQRRQQLPAQQRPFIVPKPKLTAGQQQKQELERQARDQEAKDQQLEAARPDQHPAAQPKAATKEPSPAIQDQQRQVPLANVVQPGPSVRPKERQPARTVRFKSDFKQQQDLIDRCILKAPPTPSSTSASSGSAEEVDLDEILDRFIIRVRNDAAQVLGQVRRHVTESLRGNLRVVVGPEHDPEVLQILHQDD